MLSTKQRKITLSSTHGCSPSLSLIRGSGLGHWSLAPKLFGISYGEYKLISILAEHSCQARHHRHQTAGAVPHLVVELEIEIVTGPLVVIETIYIRQPKTVDQHCENKTICTLNKKRSN